MLIITGGIIGFIGAGLYYGKITPEMIQEKTNKIKSFFMDTKIDEVFENDKKTKMK
jgi:hypothetical protein